MQKFKRWKKPNSDTNIVYGTVDAAADFILVIAKLKECLCITFVCSCALPVVIALFESMKR